MFIYIYIYIYIYKSFSHIENHFIKLFAITISYVDVCGSFNLDLINKITRSILKPSIEIPNLKISRLTSHSHGSPLTGLTLTTSHVQSSHDTVWSVLIVHHIRHGEHCISGDIYIYMDFVNQCP